MAGVTIRDDLIGSGTKAAQAANTVGSKGAVAEVGDQRG
jgi:hypothetical protein